MHLLIDNLDGRGAVDYTAAVIAKDHASTLKIERALNQPARCTAELLLYAPGLSLPSRHARVSVLSATGASLFAGAVAIEPVRTSAGASMTGHAYCAVITAVADSVLLDRPGTRMAAAGRSPFLGETVPVVQRLAANSGSSAVSGSISTTHTFAEGDGVLTINEGSVDTARELATDITLSGATEPGALVSECFLGDGVTNVFDCSSAFFHDGNATLLQDGFSGDAFDNLRWSAADPGSHLSLTGSGLTLNGGTGGDGQTSLTAIDPLEMGGSLVLELRGVQLGAACDGVLAGLYEGTLTLPDCFAGFRVRQTVSGAGSTTTLVPLLNGVEVGSTYMALAGHSYTLRLRLHCVEQQRVMQRYTCLADGILQTFGAAGGVDAPMDLVFELVDEGASSNTPATVLYDTAATGTGVSGTPATCVFAAVTAKQMFGSVATVRVARHGSAWVTTTLPNGVTYTRLLGLAGEGVDCVVSNGGSVEPGKLTFLPARVPVTGERVTVQYRLQQRAIARLQDAAGGVGTTRWLGKIISPAARSSADCSSAVQAALAYASSQSAGISGSFKVENPAADILPGDILNCTSDASSVATLVTSVELVDGAAQPELIRYRVYFANDRAAQQKAGVGLALSEGIARGAPLPATATPISDTTPAALANLQQVAVSSVTSTELHLDAGMAAPAGGGFEVRHRDAGFGSGGIDLVLRTPVRGISILRSRQTERFFIRIYDGSNPPAYSRLSSAVFVHAPVS